MKPLGLPEAEKAAEVLGLELSAVDADTLRKAFRDRVKALHPDTGAEMSAETAEKIQEAFQARVKLLAWVAMQPKSDCTICGGKGWTRSGPFGTRVCTAC